MAQRTSDKATKTLTAILVIGIIFAIIGVSGAFFTPLSEDVTGWYGLAIFGVIMVIGAILYTSTAFGKGYR